MATSPLQPILAVVQSHNGPPEHRMSQGIAPVEICFSGDPSCSNADQVEDIIKVGRGNPFICKKDHHGEVA